MTRNGIAGPARGLSGPVRSSIGGLLLAVLATLSGPHVELVGQQAQLTLAEALEIAGQNNPEYRKALNNLDLVRPASRRAFGAFLPGISLGTGTGYGFSQRRVGRDDFGNPVDNPNAIRQWSSDASQSVSASLTLFEGGRRFHDLSQSRAEGRASEWSSRAELARVRAEVARQYYRASRQRELADLEVSLVAGREQDLEVTRQLFGIAVRSQTDLLGAELELRRQQRVARSQESERLKAIEALRVSLGDPSIEIEALAPAATDVFDPASLDAAALVRLAVEGSAPVQATMAREAAAISALSGARATRWPSVSLSASLFRQGIGPETDFLFQLNPDQSRYGNLSINISIPVFRNFETSYQIASAEVARLNAGEDLTLARLQAEQNVRESLIDLEEQSDELGLRAAERDLADRRLELVREEYRLTVKSFEELQTAVRQAADARRQEVGARYDFIDAVIRLEEVVGAPVRPGSSGN